jgi:hypothetical protein
MDKKNLEIFCLLSTEVGIELARDCFLKKIQMPGLPLNATPTFQGFSN